MDIIKEIDVLYVSWLVMNVGCLIVAILFLLQDYIPRCFHLFRWGKTCISTHTKAISTHTKAISTHTKAISTHTKAISTHTKAISSTITRLLYVPNRWFIHFYVVGMIWCLVLLYLLFLDKSTWLLYIPSLIFTTHTNIQSECTSTILGLCLLLVQVSRRFVECLFISVLSGKLHIAHYIVGILFYVLAGASVTAPYLNNHNNPEWCRSCYNIMNYIDWSHLISIILFTWASIHQYKCHVILANLCSNDEIISGKKVYKIPHGDWFEYVSSPHYFAEILIYITFVIMQKATNIYLWLMLLFVAQNLTLGSVVTHSWYHIKFKEYPKNRYRIIPFGF